MSELKENDEELRDADSHANRKDGGGKQKSTEKMKVNMERILQEIQLFQRENNHQLEDIKDELNKTNQRIEEAEDRIEAVETRLQTMEQVMKKMLKVQTQHEDKLVDQEGRARRGNIRMYNVPENEEGSSMIVFMEKLLRDKLGIPPTTKLYIERAHKALAPKPQLQVNPDQL